jgi:hypothetical protein
MLLSISAAELNSAGALGFNDLLPLGLFKRPAVSKIAPDLELL